MKLLPKFALLSIGVAAVPLAIAGYSSSRISHRALHDALLENELMIARGEPDERSRQAARALENNERIERYPDR